MRNNGKNPLIKAVVVKKFDKSVEFIDVPEAEQYRTSLKMKESK